MIAKQLDGAPHETLLTVDATTGQNGLRQARAVLARRRRSTGIVLTKLDGTAKGGIALAIARELGIPVKLIGIGEQLEDLRPFDADEFAQALLAPLTPDGTRYAQLTMDAWVIWLIVAVVLAVGEIATTSFFLGPFALGALRGRRGRRSSAAARSRRWVVFVVATVARVRDRAADRAPPPAPAAAARAPAPPR